MLNLLVALCSTVDRWQSFETFCEIRDSEVRESSGVGASRLYGGEYYTHNDSGDTARFFRFDQEGRIKGVWTLKGVKATDWEDMATARVKGKNWIYLADVGDNSEKRKSVFIYKLEEPKGTGGEIRQFETYELAYPDRPHNCEAMFVDPGSGDLYLVTKSETSALVFRVKAPSGSGRSAMERCGELKPDTGLGKYGRLVTGGDASPDGRYVALRTYSGILEYAVGDSFASWTKATPILVKPPIEAQGESVCYSLDGKRLVTTSEGTPCPVHIANRKK